MPKWLFVSRPSNTAVHLLCKQRVPANVRSLLGLGLNFCLSPKDNKGIEAIDLERLRRDYAIRIQFAGDDNETPELYLPNKKWKPNDPPMECKVRMNAFCRDVTTLATRHHYCHTPSNLLPLQRHALRLLRADKQLMVIKADKNLGPVLIERLTYIQRILDEHLRDTDTYRSLSEQQAKARIKAITKMINNFADRYFQKESNNWKFLKRSISRFDDPREDPFAYFYATAKIHKQPWKTRPIVSSCGSILEGLGQWIDKQLQKLCQFLPNVVRSSRSLVQDLRQKFQEGVPPRTKLFTMDARSMYTKINTTHAIEQLGNMLRTPKWTTIAESLQMNIDALLNAISIVMRNNVFKFGDLYILQLTGTAMGTPPAPPYSTIYYSIHEQVFLVAFSDVLTYYGRYIDDGFGLWTAINNNIEEDNQRWNEFKASVDAFGDLRWDFSDRTDSVNYLDLTISIKNGRLTTTVYEKAMNLYLYLPPHSAHPPGVLRSLINGRVKTIYDLTLQDEDRLLQLQRLFQRLCRRGYSPGFLKPLFTEALRNRTTSKNKTDASNALILHVQYHPRQAARTEIQKIFRSTLLQPPGEPELPMVTNRQRQRLGLNRLIVAYHRPRNLGNLLSQRKLRCPDGKPVSSYLS